jgi:hypothetical protein
VQWRWIGSRIETHQCAGDVDAAIADGGVVKPFWLGEAEETVVGDVHGCCGGS